MKSNKNDWLGRKGVGVVLVSEGSRGGDVEGGPGWEERGP